MMQKPARFLDRSAWRAAGRRWLDRLAPVYCRLCDMPTASSLALCTVCRGELLLNIQSCSRCALPLPGSADTGSRLCPKCLQSPPLVSRVLAPFVYDASLAFVMSRWKYHREQHLAFTAAGLWLESMFAPQTVDLLVPVPLHWRRMLRRGFNQSADLAGYLATALEFPLANGRDSRLKRNRATPAQAGASRRQRLKNLNGAFGTRGDVSGLRIALVDDVCTTGATSEAAASALLSAGAADVQLWCLARTPES